MIRSDVGGGRSIVNLKKKSLNKAPTAISVSLRYRETL